MSKITTTTSAHVEPITMAQLKKAVSEMNRLTAWEYRIQVRAGFTPMPVALFPNVIA